MDFLLILLHRKQSQAHDLHYTEPRQGKQASQQASRQGPYLNRDSVTLSIKKEVDTGSWIKTDRLPRMGSGGSHESWVSTWESLPLLLSSSGVLCVQTAKHAYAGKQEVHFRCTL